MSVSIKDVAARARVSVGTVSNVLNSRERVSTDVATRVDDAIRDLGYVRNDAARQLRAGRSTAIGLVILDVGNPFFTDLARGAEDEAMAAGYSIILGNSDEKADREAAYLDLFEQQRMRGVLISPLGDITDRLQRLRERGIPAVLVDRTTADPSFSSVSVDDIAGGALAMEHLVAIGRRHVAFVGGPVSIRQVSDRLEGARRAASLHPGTKLEVVEVDALSVLAGRTAGLDIVARQPADRPDAIFAANDLVAVGVLQALVMNGSTVRVPDEIALVGYDDIDFARATVFPLTSVRQPSALIGQTAVRILLEEAGDPTIEPRQVVFQPELVVRESTRNDPATRRN